MDRFSDRWKGQEKVILQLFQSNPKDYFTAEDVHARGGFDAATPLTSIRRGVTNLMKAGEIEKTGRKKPGSYGESIHCYKYKMKIYQKYYELLGESWAEAIGDFMDSPYMGRLYAALRKQNNTKIIHPTREEDVFKAFRMTPLDKVSVVIVGQDPYNSYTTEPDVAEGLAFSSGNKDVQPPSLKEILNAVEQTYGLNLPLLTSTSLHGWTYQGVLLLNQALTCAHNKPGSHLQSWRPFFHRILDELKVKKHLVWLLWGAEAKKYANSILANTHERHTVITTEHPAAASYRGIHSEWDYEDCFTRTNEALKAHKQDTIDWTSPEPLPWD